MNLFIETVLPQIFGALGMVCLYCSYQQTKRERLIACKLGSDVMWAVHYLLLGAVGGAIPNFVGIFRELVFINREKHKWARFPLWPVFFIAVNMGLALAKLETPLTLLPICASAFVTVSLWLKNPRMTRIICAPVSLCFLIYDIFVGSWVGVINESIALISIVSSFVKNDIKKSSEEKETNA